MSVKHLLVVLAIIAFTASAWAFVPWFDIQRWAAAEQRGFQNAMAGALRGIQVSEPLALWALCSATAAYGFFHALGPGHGKVLIGGAALASGATLRRLTILTVLSSLAQAASAILLVGSLVLLVQMGSKDLADMTETFLVPASYAAIVFIGGVLVFRGLRTWFRVRKAKHVSHSCCGHAHGPSVENVGTLNSTSDAAALIASIALRPCTGALFVLVIAARFDAFAAGCLAVVTMGFGTAAFNLIVASSGVAAHRLARLGGHNKTSVQNLSAMLHVTGGLLIVAISLGMILPYLK